MFLEEIKVMQSSTSLADTPLICSIVNSAETSSNDLRSAHVGIHGVSEYTYFKNYLNFLIVNYTGDKKLLFYTTNYVVQHHAIIFPLTSLAPFNFSPIL